MNRNRRAEGPAAWLSRSLTLFVRHWPVFCLQGLALLVLAAPPLAAALIHYLVVTVREWNEALTGNSTDAVGEPAEIYRALGWVAVAMAPVSLLSNAALTGMLFSAARAWRGETPVFADLKRGLHRPFSTAGSTLLSTLLTSSLLLWLLAPAILYSRGVPAMLSLLVASLLTLLIPPSLYLLGRTILIHPFIVNQDLSLAAAVPASWRATSGSPWTFCGWAILIYLVAGAGLVTGAGLAASLPLAALMLQAGFEHAGSTMFQAGETLATHAGDRTDRMLQPTAEEAPNDC